MPPNTALQISRTTRPVNHTVWFMSCLFAYLFSRIFFHLISVICLAGNSYVCKLSVWDSRPAKKPNDLYC